MSGYMVTDRMDNRGTVYDRTAYGVRAKASDRCNYEGCQNQKDGASFCYRHWR